MTGGYAMMPFRLRGCCGRSNKTFNEIYGEGTISKSIIYSGRRSLANKRMGGGGNQKHAVPSMIAPSRQYYLYSHIRRNTSNKRDNKSFYL